MSDRDDPTVQNQGADDSLNVVDPFGNIGSLAKADAHGAISNGGYRLASQEEVQQQKNEQQYGGAQGAVFSTALGAARTASLGASDLALESLPEGVGFSKEELKGFRETNPTANLVGELGGILQDPFGLSKLINTAGKATSAGAKTLLGAAGMAEDSSRAVAILNNTLQHSVEGALYGGIASTMDDYALGDPSLNGEKILTNMGYGYFLGGATGGITKALGYGITPTIRKAMGALADIRNELIGSGYGEEALISKVLPKRFAEAIQDRQLNLDTNGQGALMRKMSDNLNTVTDSVQQEIADFGKQVNSKAMSALFKSSSEPAAEAQQQVGQFLSQTVEQLKAVVPDAKSQGLLDTISDGIKMGALKGGTSEAIFDGLKELRGHIVNLVQKDPSLAEMFTPHLNQIDEYLKNPKIFGAAGAAMTLHEENVAGLRTFLSDDPNNLTPFQQTFGVVKGGKWQFDINKMHEAFTNPDYNLRQTNLQMLSDFFEHLNNMPQNLGNARKVIPNSIWRKRTIQDVINNAQKTHAQAFEDYLKGISKRRPLYGWKDLAPVVIAKWSPVLGAALEAYDFYQDPVHASHELALIERMIGKTTKKSLDLVDSIFSRSVPDRLLIEERGGSAIDREADKDEKREKFKHFVTDPRAVAENMEKSTKELSEVAPNIATQLHAITGNAASFLQSKMPVGNDHVNPLGSKYEMSNQEAIKFENYRKIVEDPLESLRQVRDRTISPETVETLNSVFPKFYQEMKEAVIKKAFEVKTKGETIPFQTRQAVATFLGAPIDEALSPQSILNNQLMISAQPQPNQHTPSQLKTRSSGLLKLSQSKRAANDYSAIEED